MGLRNATSALAVVGNCLANGFWYVVYGICQTPHAMQHAFMFHGKDGLRPSAAAVERVFKHDMPDGTALQNWVFTATANCTVQSKVPTCSAGQKP
jgi:hypothetical protein